MKKAIVTVFYNKNNNAGPKAQMDVIKFLKPLNYTDVTLPFDVRSRLGKFKYALYDLPKFFRNSEVRFSFTINEVLTKNLAVALILNCFTENK